MISFLKWNCSPYHNSMEMFPPHAESLKCKYLSCFYFVLKFFVIVLRRSIHTVYAKPVISVIDSFCSVLRSHPMLLVYLNEYKTEYHSTPAAYLFFLKLFSLLEYPMLTFNFFHPFHPSVTLIKHKKLDKQWY